MRGRKYRIKERDDQEIDGPMLILQRKGLADSVVSASDMDPHRIGETIKGRHPVGAVMAHRIDDVINFAAPPIPPDASQAVALAAALIDREGKVRHVHRGYQAGYERHYEQQVKELLK